LQSGHGDMPRCASASVSGSFATGKGDLMTTKQERLIVLGRLSSVLAHEIRNPLAGISAASQILDGKIGGTDPRKKYVGMILKEVERVNGIVANLLDFSREGRACLVRANVRTIVASALAPFAAQFDRAGIRVVVQHDDDVPPVACDPAQIGQVFRHLISNAVDAMAGGGTLTVRTAYDTATRHVAVHFEDTGVGIEVDDLTELFSPFYTTKTKGSGLGLPVALKLVEEHGGAIRAARREPCGLTMVVEWPVEAAPSAGSGSDGPGSDCTG
jgi:two-component system sensor histidine kinase HydH